MTDTATRRPAPGETPRIRQPDREKMEAGIRLFLEGCGVDLDDANVRETPERVARAWADEFLDGYDTEPRQALGAFYYERKPAADEMVLVTSIDFQSMCPHHLLPTAAWPMWPICPPATSWAFRGWPGWWTRWATG